MGARDHAPAVGRGHSPSVRSGGEVMGHGHKSILPEHVAVYDQNHAAGSEHLDTLVMIHREHTADGCSRELTTACITAELLKMMRENPVTVAVVLGIAVERLAAEK